jgi:site-specific DNA-cytosine methylase
MMRWVERHRPLIVIQDNVSGATWTEMRQYFMDRDYSAEFHQVNSWEYYIPHTRQRGYLFALNVKNSTILNKWIDAVKKNEATLNGNP